MSENWKVIKTAWKGDMTFLAENDSGGQAEMGSGRASEVLSPMEMVLAALAGCTGVDIVSILKKKRVDLQDCQVNVRAARADEHPKVYTKCHVEYLFWGENIKEKDVEQAIQLSEEKYCSVSAMMKTTATLSHSYKILKPGQAAE